MMHTPSIWRSFDRPFTSMSSWRPLMQQFDDMFNDMLELNNLPSGSETTASLTPACDIDESDDKFILSFDMPGVPKENIQIEVRERTLFVSGERQDERRERDHGYSRSERRYGRFVRSISLPENIVSEKVEAHYEDGVLAVIVPKSSEQWARKVEVNQGKPGFMKSLFGRNKTEDTSAQSEPLAKEQASNTRH